MHVSKKPVKLREEVVGAQERTFIDNLTPIPLDVHILDPHHEDDELVPRWLRPFGKFRADFDSIIALLDFLTKRQGTAWAILVVSFNDDPKPSPTLTKYEKVFTSAGASTMNMLDYFEDMSH